MEPEKLVRISTCQPRSILKNQQEHHKKITFEEEYRNLLLQNGIIPDEKYFP